MKPSTSFKKDLFAHFARIARVLGNGNRLELLELLAQGERNVEALANTARLSIANTSQHLQQLRQTGLVKARKHGLQVYYSLGDEDVVELLQILHRIGERNLTDIRAMVDSYLGVKDRLEPVAPAVLWSRMQDGTVTLLDVRPAEEFQAGHLPGAINVPVAELPERVADLSHNREIVAYCRGPYCVYSFDAVELLRGLGYSARRMEDGFPEWKQAGFPVVREDAA